MAISKKKRRNCFARDKVCLKCGSCENLTIDHVIPKSLGGRDWFINLQTLCKKCNSEKDNNIAQYSNYKRTRLFVRRFKNEGAYWLNT